MLRVRTRELRSQHCSALKQSAATAKAAYAPKHLGSGFSKVNVPALLIPSSDLQVVIEIDNR
jgi:hypothetical protein